MKAVFVNMKSQLTVCKSALEAAGFEVFRTRTECGCTPGQNRRNAIVAINKDNAGVKVIRCRGCAAKWEGGAK